MIHSIARSMIGCLLDQQQEENIYEIYRTKNQQIIMGSDHDL